MTHVLWDSTHGLGRDDPDKTWREYPVLQACEQEELTLGLVLVIIWYINVVSVRQSGRSLLDETKGI